ncbi:MAG: replication-associated recombination protein A [Proteobacteria bacterium]|nr:MAG: replication-associated recombination protein A [Pseudomonadota bacterium]
MDLFSGANGGSGPAKKELPLAERMRPRTLDEVVGQAHLIGEGKPLSMLANNPPSIIFWGPPGVGKTTLAKLLSGDRPFYQISAVLDGVAELRKVIDSLKHESRSAVLFVDEIHRWNKAQQDSLLPYLENGTFTLIGATTENPSFSLIAPLLSRAKVFTLKSLGAADIREILQRALGDRERGLAARFIRIDAEAMDFLAEDASGDARKALHTLDIAAGLNHNITLEVLKAVLQKRVLRYDKTGEQHYDIISAFIKSMRGSDADAAVYYLARMYEAGEDPRFLARRMVIFAAEDVGLGDPRALQIAVAAAEAFDRIGIAEGWIPLSEAAVYLALAPKSNASYMAYKRAKAAVEAHGDLPVPLHLRNAPTKLMKDLGYGSGYEYAHDAAEGKPTHAHLPEELVGEKFYVPGKRGFEKLLFEKKDK